MSDNLVDIKRILELFLGKVSIKEIKEKLVDEENHEIHVEEYEKRLYQLLPELSKSDMEALLARYYKMDNHRLDIEAFLEELDITKERIDSERIENDEKLKSPKKIKSPKKSMSPKNIKCTSPKSPKKTTSPKRVDQPSSDDYIFRQYELQKRVIKKLYHKRNHHNLMEIIDAIEIQDEDGKGILPIKIIETILDKELYKPLDVEEKEYLFKNLEDETNSGYLLYRTMITFLSIDVNDQSEISISSSSSSEDETRKALNTQVLGAEYLYAKRQLQKYIESPLEKENGETGGKCLMDSLRAKDSRIHGKITGKLSRKDMTIVISNQLPILSESQVSSILLSYSSDETERLRYADFLALYGYKEQSITKSIDLLDGALGEYEIQEKRKHINSFDTFRNALEKEDRLQNGRCMGRITFQSLQKIISDLDLSITSGDIRCLCNIDEKETLQKSSMLDYRCLLVLLREKRNAQIGRYGNGKDSLFRGFVYRALHKIKQKDLLFTLRQNFESADQMKNGSICGILSDRDFFTVLNVLNLVTTVNEKDMLRSVLVDYGAVTREHINYMIFLRHVADHIPMITIDASTKKEQQETPKHLSVSLYMEKEATKEERENFNQLMSFLNTIQYRHSPRNKNHNDDNAILSISRVNYDKDEMIYALGPRLKLALRFQVD